MIIRKEMKMCFYLFAEIILFIIFIKLSQNEHDNCYSGMEDCGIAMFGCCCGGNGKKCKDCPYYVDINEETK